MHMHSLYKATISTLEFSCIGPINLPQSLNTEEHRKITWCQKRTEIMASKSPWVDTETCHMVIEIEEKVKFDIL